jgi:predicted transcriptional regulator
VFKTAAVAQASAEEHHSAVHVDISPEAVEEIHKEVSELKALAENIEEVV